MGLSYASTVEVDDFTSAKGKGYKNNPQEIRLRDGKTKGTKKETKEAFIQRLPYKIESLIREKKIRVAKDMLSNPGKFMGWDEDSECGSVPVPPPPPLRDEVPEAIVEEA